MQGTLIRLTFLVAMLFPSAPALAASAGSASAIDLVHVEKRAGTVTLLSRGRPVRRYLIKALGAAPEGHKEREGDERTPEGLYYIDEKHESARYRYFIGISYPSARDRQRAARLGVAPGGAIGIHGFSQGPEGVAQRRSRYWTDGCIALEDADVAELYQLVTPGTPIRIKP
ncbi:MAG: L,D-transpeptidase family protein [Pseudomonadota bacterium]